MKLHNGKTISSCNNCDNNESYGDNGICADTGDDLGDPNIIPSWCTLLDAGKDVIIKMGGRNSVQQTKVEVTHTLTYRGCEDVLCQMREQMDHDTFTKLLKDTNAAEESIRIPAEKPIQFCVGDLVELAEDCSWGRKGDKAYIHEISRCQGRFEYDTSWGAWLYHEQLNLVKEADRESLKKVNEEMLDEEDEGEE